MNIAVSTLEEDLEAFYRNPSIDPVNLYHRLHREAPVIKDPAGVWVISRYDDAQVVAGCKTAAWGSLVPMQVAHGPLTPTTRITSLWVAAVEGEVHQRLRHLIGTAFTPKIVDQLTTRIGKIVDDLIDGVIDKGSMDLVHDFSYPLPITVIAEMLGIAEEDRWLLVDVTSAIVQAHDFNATDKDRAHADDLSQQFADMVERYVDERRRSPKSDILNALVQAEEAGDKLSRDELISTCSGSAAAHRRARPLAATGHVDRTRGGRGHRRRALPRQIVLDLLALCRTSNCRRRSANGARRSPAASSGCRGRRDSRCHRRLRT